MMSTNLTISSVAFSSIKYVHNAVQPLPLPISGPFSYSQTEIWYPLNDSCPRPSPSVRWPPPAAFSRAQLLQGPPPVESYSVRPLASGLFHSVSCLRGRGMRSFRLSSVPCVQIHVPFVCSSTRGSLGVLHAPPVWVTLLWTRVNRFLLESCSQHFSHCWLSRLALYLHPAPTAVVRAVAAYTDSAAHEQQTALPTVLG